MEAKIRKDVQLFKRILTHDKFGDHVEEIRFPNTICLTGVKIGAAPGVGSPTDTPHVHVFAQDLHTFSGSRYACVAEHCNLPDSGTRAVRVEPIFTKQLLLRGQYQTLPLAIYGWTLPSTTIIKESSELTRAAQSQLAVASAWNESQNLSASSIMPPQSPFCPPFLTLPADALQALQAILPRWASVRTFEQAMRYQSLDKAHVQALLTAAERICQAAARQSPQLLSEGQTAAATTNATAVSTVKEEPEVDLVGNSSLLGLQDTMLMDLDPITSLPAADATTAADSEPLPVNEADVRRCAAYMAAEWCTVLGGAFPSAAAAEFGLAGLAAAVIVSSSPQHAIHFIEAQGHLALASVLSILRPPKSVVRHAITAIELLTRSAGALACEATFGWLELPELSEDVVQSAQATAAAIGAAAAKRRAGAATGLGTGLNTQQPQGPAKAGAEDTAARSGKGTESTGPSNLADGSTSHHSDDQGDQQDGQEHNQLHMHDEDRPQSEDGSRQQDQADYDAMYNEMHADEQDPEYDIEAYANQQDADEQDGDQQEGDDQYNGDSQGMQAYDEQQDADVDAQQIADDNQEGTDPAEQPGTQADQWDIPDRGGDIDEMMAETPERLSDLEQDEGPDQTDRPLDGDKPTGKASQEQDEAEKAASPSRPVNKADQGQQQPSHVQVDDKMKQHSGRADEKERHRGESKERKRSSRHDKERRRKHSRDRHRSRDRSKDRERDRDRRHKERKSRSKRSRSRSRSQGHDDERAVKRSHHDQAHPSRERHPRDRTTPEPMAARSTGDGAREPFTAPHSAPPRIASQPKGLLVVKAKQFDGCYSQIVDKLLDVQPKQVVATGSLLLARLRLYSMVAKATETAEQLVKGHMGGAPQLSMRQTSELITTLGVRLTELAEELVQSDDHAPSANTKGLAADQPGNHLPRAGAPDPCTVTSLASRQLLELLAAVLHVPSLHAAHMVASGTLPAQAKSPQVEAALMQPLLSGCKAVVSVLLSTPSGMAYLVQQQEACQALISALSTRSSGTKGCSVALAATLGAVTAVQQVVADAYGPATPTGPPQGQLLLQDVLQVLCEQSISLVGKQAVNTALTVVPGAVQKFLTLLQSNDTKQEGFGTSSKAQPHFSLACMCAGQLLLQLVSDDHPQVLRCWAGHAAELNKLAGEALPATSVARGRHTLQALQARAQAAMSLADKGPTSLVKTLSGVLPPLANSDVKGIYVVEAESAVQFMHDVGKLNTAEGALHLLAAVLSQQHASLDAVAATEVNGLQALERALRTGVMLLTAAQADTMWSISCGDAIDDAKQATNRWQVVKFVLAVSNAIRALFARLQQRNTHLNSISLLDCLLAAHAAVSSSSESLAAAVGNAPASDSQCMLQARQALTGALKIWWDNAPDWQPALLPAIFVGAKAAAMDRMADTIKMPGGLYSRISLISDLFPSEWPPVQVRKGVPHPPPTHKDYRVALAKSLEPVVHGFRDMITIAVASESRMFRAALVRLAARAAGLGGPMGLLLAQPITNALKEALATSAALSEVRRILELIVPLAYRPPIKAAFLDLKLAGVLGELLGRLVPVLAQGPDAGSLCTMVLEAILTLQDPETCLNPMAPAVQRVPDETPAPTEGGLIAATIMASLSRLGGNAHVAKRILKNLSTHLPGRVMLRLGAAKWQANMTGGDFAKAVGSKASLQWAASRLWAAAEAVGGDPKLRSTNQEVAQILEQAAALGEDAGEADLPPPSGPAPHRFAAAVKASVEAAAAAGTTKAAEASDFLETAQPLVQLFDPASNTFWRNVKERAVAPVTAFGRNPVRWDVWRPQHVPAISRQLPGPLTPAKRSREVRLGGSSQGGLGGASPPQKLKVESSSGAGQNSAAVPMPGDDLPPVIAPPGRSRAAQLRGRSGGNSSRPASLHVDDFEKAASTAIPPTLNLVPKPPIAQPSPAGLSSLKSGSLTPRDTSTPTALNPVAPARIAGTTSALASGGSDLAPHVPAAGASATPATAPPATATGPAAFASSPGPAAQQGMLNRAVRPEIKQEPSFTPAPPSSVSDFASTNGAASMPAAQQPGSASQLLASAPVLSLPLSGPLSQAGSLDTGLTSGQPAAADTADGLQSTSRAPDSLTDQQAAELIEVDPFEGMDIGSSTANLQPGQLDQSLPQTSNAVSQLQSTAAMEPMLGNNTPAMSQNNALPSISAPTQSSQAQQPNVTQPPPLQPGSSAPEEEPFDLYSDFSTGPSPQQGTNQASMAPHNMTNSLQQPSHDAAQQPQPSASSLSQLGSGPQQSPATSPHLLRRSSSTSQAAAAPAATGVAGGLSHRDPRRSSGSRTMAQPGRPVPAAAAMRDPRQVAAAADAQAARPQLSAAAPQAAATAAGTAPVARQSAPATTGAAADMPRQTSVAAAAPSVARQSPAVSDTAAARPAGATSSAHVQTVSSTGPGPTPAADASAGATGGAPQRPAQAASNLAANPQIAGLLKALTQGGQALQVYIQARPEMRAYIPVLLQQMKNRK